MRKNGLAALLVLAACGDPSPAEPPPTGHGDDIDSGSEASQPCADASGNGDASRATESWTGVDAAEGEGGSDSCAGLPLCDGFEGDVLGAAPDGWSIVMGCNPNTQDSTVDGGGLLVGVDGARHHGGSHALRVVGGDSCGFYAVQQSALAKLGPQLYARFWVLFSGSPTQNHNGFLSMPTQGGDHLRLGFQDGVLAWNAQLSDATLPDMDPQGTVQSAATTADTWACLELHLDETDGHLAFWMNGDPVPGLGYDGGNVQGVDDQWARGAPSPANPTSLGLGWLGLNDQQTVWFDDVALGSARIGCN